MRKPALKKIGYIKVYLPKPAAVAEWVERLCSEREIPRLNPAILPLLSSACRERDGLPCRIQAYTVYTPIGGKGRCCTRCDLQDHRKRERVQVRSTLDLKPMRKDTQSPKQEQSVAPRKGPWSNKNLKKKKKKKEYLPSSPGPAYRSTWSRPAWPPAARVTCNLPLNSAPPDLLTLEELKLTYLDSPTAHVSWETPTDIKFSATETFQCILFTIRKKEKVKHKMAMFILTLFGNITKIWYFVF